MDTEVAPVAPQRVMGGIHVVVQASLAARFSCPPRVVVAVAVQATLQSLAVCRVQDDDEEEEDVADPEED
jgi:hypothetical protein